MDRGDIKDAGALAGIVRYGIPWHGTIESGVLSTGKLDETETEVTREWAQPATSDCWLIQKPGLPDPYAGEGGPERKAADALNGHELTNWALLSGSGDIHGQAYVPSADLRQRWIWIDDAGDAYAVEFGFVDGTAQTGSQGPYTDADGLTATDYALASDITARFRFTRFGHLKVNGEPAVPVDIDLVLDASDLGQTAPSLSGIPIYPGASESFAEGCNVLLRDLTPTGNKAIVELHSLVFDTARNRVLTDYGGTVDGKPRFHHREISNSIGYLLFSLSGSGGAPSVVMSVLANRAATLGSYSYTRPVADQTGEYVCLSCEDGSCTGMYVYTLATTVATVAEDRIVGYYFDDELAPQPQTVGYSRTITRSDDVSHNSHITDELTTTTVTADIGAHSISFTKTVDLSSTADIETTNYSISTTDDTGSGYGNGTTSGSYDLPRAYLAYDSILESQCGTSQDMTGGFTPSYDNTRNLTLHGGMFDGNNAYFAGVVHHGSCALSLLTNSNGVGAIGVCSHLASSEAWQLLISSGARLHGAWNPQTETLVYPKRARVNFT